MVGALAAALDAVPAPAAGPRVLAVDGRSGSGKTGLAAALADALAAPVVHLDDLYPGWDGLAAAVELLRGVLAGLRGGGAVRHPVWDWAADAYRGEVRLPSTGVVVVEGVGAGCAGPVEVLVWLEAAAGVRRRRALARDGEVFAPHWDSWAAQEERLFAAHDVRARADVVLLPGGEDAGPGAGRARWTRAR
ncbi:dephospho-CoA kinase [Kineococcus sp. T13]|uniref:dephospho-CoA kinase n=1 Tax=Kineococcus vitellinus TaxID=2696565 RepID=UPI0014131F3B|nr:dephospho-CoA kinase [Kineococcus vitellinus]NAZ77638.1 dephospho-CoA kinase [Kineococcus vitellinus]